MLIDSKLLAFTAFYNPSHLWRKLFFCVCFCAIPYNHALVARSTDQMLIKAKETSNRSCMSTQCMQFWVLDQWTIERIPNSDSHIYRSSYQITIMSHHCCKRKKMWFQRYYFVIIAYPQILIALKEHTNDTFDNLHSS